MRALTVAGLALVVTLVAGVVGARNAARWLVVADPLPAHADAIVVLAGPDWGRAIEGARLWRAGVAPIVVTAREQLMPGEAALHARGVRPDEAYARVVAALVALGVPRDAVHVVRRRTRSTLTEANAIARWACRTGVHSVVAVTSPWHTRRVRLLLRAALGPGIPVAVRPARTTTFVTTHWWRHRRSAKAVLSEWEKLAHWAVDERWHLRPCGGLRRRGAGVTAAGGGYAALLAACRTSGASSPRACISRTMSQPPMNLPPTNTCGIVGQLVKAFTPSRLSPSARTSTALNGTPMSWSTSTVAAEKPHIGNVGVPFM
jgi:uncharacterized SAM-binding protein YcdF (DUF218 family)